LIKNATKAIVSSHLTLEGLKSTKGTIGSKGMLTLIKDNIKYHFNQLINSNAKRGAGV
jgi:hypothetical protein